MTCRKFLTFVDRHTKKFGSGFQLSKKALKTAYVALKKRGGGGKFISTYSNIFKVAIRCYVIYTLFWLIFLKE